jgi:cytochrome P450
MEGFMAVWSKDSGACAPLFSPEFQRDPYPTYRHHLAGPSLQPLEGRPGVWLLFGYEACTKVVRDGRLSAKRPANTLVAVADDALPEFGDLVRHMHRWLLLRDAPRHTELRKLMNRGFTPAVVDRLKDKVDGIVDVLLDEMGHADTVDLIKDFAYPLPVRVICELLGVPEELHDRCVVLSNDIAVWIGDFRRPPESARVAQQAVLELEGYFASTVRERRRAPKDDLLGLLMSAGEAAGGLSEEDLLAQCVMLLFAGHETTRNLIGNGIFTLLRNPDALGELRRDDALWSAAVEELLRYESPVQGFGRGVTADLEIDGRHLPAGSSIVFMVGAAHRDARQYTDPDRLDLRRPHNRHLAFGGDAHVCLGSTLARLEGRSSLRAVARRFPNLRLVDETPDWGSNFGLRGMNTLRVQL